MIIQDKIAKIFENSSLHVVVNKSITMARGLWKGKIMKAIFFIIAVFVVFGPVSGNSWGQDKGIQKEIFKAGTMVETNNVCMVNNSFMGREQIPVEFEGKTYYGCCQGCVAAIQNKRSVRYAVDPATGKEVDKAKAYIVIKDDGSRKVSYFESESSYKRYLKERQL